jgi:ABC-type multidrug transport system ATPase subunit
MEILLKSLAKSYSEPVWKNVSVRIPEANIVAVLGQNGSGKTTLLRILAGLTQHDSGTVTYGGTEFHRSNLALRKNVMFLADFPSFFEQMNPLELVTMHLKLWDAVRSGVEDRVADFFHRLGILACAYTPMRRLSRGQAYKVALTALMCVDPEIWLLDEPFAAGMDLQGINVFRQEVELAARKRNRTILYTTQLPELACGLSDNVAVLASGGLSMYATDGDLARNPEKLNLLLPYGLAL